VGCLKVEFLIDTHGGGLEHDPEKWKPVFRNDHADSENRILPL
jgi:hypothetical protein